MPERSDRKNRLMRTIVSHSLSKPSRSTENLRRRGVYPPGVAPTSNRQLEGLALFDAWPGPIRPRVSHGSLVAMVLALSLASLGLPAEVQGLVQVQTWAVVVGIDDYRNFGDWEGGDLRGAESDALAMGNALRDFWNVPGQNVLTILGDEATREAIQTALTEWLPARVSAGDDVFFYFAGNGSRTLDTNGDEADGLDETICPTDVVSTSSQFDITDDELNAWLSALASDRVVVILDAGHGGTAPGKALGYLRNRSLGRYTPRARPIAGGDSGHDDTVADAWIVQMAAAPVGQFAAEFEISQVGDSTVYGGAFTTHLLRQIQRAAPGTTLEDLYWMTFHSVKADQFRQEPTLSGPADRFSLPGRSANTAMIRVASVESEIVNLVGAVAGSLRAGTVLRTGSGAMFRVEVAPSGRTATALLLSGTPAPGEEAAVVGVPPLSDVLRVSVELDGHRSTGLVESLVRGTTGAILVRPESAPHIAARFDNGRFSLVGRDGAVKASLGEDPDGPAWSHELRLAADFQRLGSRENPTNPFRVDVRIMGDSEILAGDELKIQVRGARAGFLTLVDLATNGTATVIFPNPYSGPGRIPAGEDLIIPRDGNFKLRTTFPTGLGMVRAFVTDRPLGVDTGDGFAASGPTRDLVAEISESLNAVAPAAAVPASDILIDPTSWSSGFAFYTVR